jgi:hypothetical protein
LCSENCYFINKKCYSICPDGSTCTEKGTKCDPGINGEQYVEMNECPKECWWYDNLCSANKENALNSDFKGDSRCPYTGLKAKEGVTVNNQNECSP